MIRAKNKSKERAPVRKKGKVLVPPTYLYTRHPKNSKVHLYYSLYEFLFKTFTHLALTD